MSPQQLTLFLVAYAAVAGFAAVLAALWRGHGFAWFAAVVSLLSLFLATWFGGAMFEGQNILFAAWSAIVRFDRSEVSALALGTCAALPTFLLLHSGGRAGRRRSGVRFIGAAGYLVGVLGTLAVAGLLAGKEVLSPFLPHPDSEFAAGSIGALVPDGFVVEEFVDTNIIPIRIAVSPTGRVFVSGHEGIAAQSGAIVELVEESDGTVRETTVASMLNRPYGLLALDDRLFVSRSGQYDRWTHGVPEQISTGAVTMLQDLDGDGTMDYYHDVLSDLPGARGPDYLHQNNALAMGPDGALYATTANNTDGHPARALLEGVVLRASGDDFENVEVFATGLRNPFGLAFDGTGRLFATDNDSQSGVLGTNPGDKLLHVTQGAFFGHPYADDKSPGVSPHALRSQFALGGLTYADSAALPAQWRDSLFVVVYGEGRIMQVRLNDNDEVAADLIPFATVPGAVDIAATPDGSFLVAVYPDKIMRIRAR